MKNLENVFAAYVLVWAVFFVYYLTLNQRASKLKHEIERLKQLLKRD